MTIMFCQKCHQVTDCNVEVSSQKDRLVYFNEPYMNAYVRLRTCENCNKTFRTYEISEESFLALRKIAEKTTEISEFIDKTWTKTKTAFETKYHLKLKIEKSEN